MKTQIKMLKVKIKSLADEARVIRLEEKRAMRRGRDAKLSRFADPELQRHLWQHRTVDLRGEQRSALLAYAFLRGRPYAAAEPKAATPPDWERVRRIAEKFGGRPGVPAAVAASAVAEWAAAQKVS